MKTNLSLAGVVLLILISCGTDKTRTSQSNETGKNQTDTMIAYETVGKIIKLNEALDEIIASDAQIEILADGFNWSEGPVWIAEGGYLIFSDVPENKIFKWKAGEGKSIYLEPSGYTGEGAYSSEPGSNGLTLDPAGKLLLCQHGDRRIARMIPSTGAPAPEFETVADSYNGHRFNSPNDLAVYKDGSVYFTDPPYGLPGRENSDIAELDYNGVYRVRTDGSVQLLTDALSRPNGIAFSPDYKLCYVNVSDPENAVIMVYEVNETDGSFSEGSLFFNAGPLMTSGPGLPDGLKIHPSGTLFSTGPGGVLVISPEGLHLGTINTTQATANCAFDADFSYLYMTADRYLLRVKLKK